MHKLLWDVWKFCLPISTIHTQKMKKIIVPYVLMQLHLTENFSLNFGTSMWVGSGPKTLKQKRTPESPGRAPSPAFFSAPASGACTWFSHITATSAGHKRCFQEVFSGLTQMFLHCVSWTLIQGCVPPFQAAHLWIQHVLAVVSGDGESALHRVCIVCATTSTYVWDPL